MITNPRQTLRKTYASFLLALASGTILIPAATQAGEAPHDYVAYITSAGADWEAKVNRDNKVILCETGLQSPLALMWDVTGNAPFSLKGGCKQLATPDWRDAEESPGLTATQGSAHAFGGGYINMTHPEKFRPNFGNPWALTKDGTQTDFDILERKPIEYRSLDNGSGMTEHVHQQYNVTGTILVIPVSYNWVILGVSSKLMIGLSDIPKDVVQFGPDTYVVPAALINLQDSDSSMLRYEKIESAIHGPKIIARVIMLDTLTRN